MKNPFINFVNLAAGPIENPHRSNPCPVRTNDRDGYPEHRRCANLNIIP
uniref:Uncharacterized protein n=1 Tax=Bursaphelenchus xylophilus TaxID=6326 RepID=A0A1I7SNN3_BURXY